MTFALNLMAHKNSKQQCEYMALAVKRILETERGFKMGLHVKWKF
jgi:hypothetical protein